MSIRNADNPDLLIFWHDAALVMPPIEQEVSQSLVET